MATAACKTSAGVRSGSLPIKFITAGCKTVSSVVSATGKINWSGSDSTRKQVDWLPQPTVPVLDKNGNMAQPWYKFFREVADRRLGGIDAQTLPDVVTTQGQVQSQVLSVSSGVEVVGQQVSAITTTVNTQTEVAQQNNLSGSSQLSKLPSYKQQQLLDNNT